MDISVVKKTLLKSMVPLVRRCRGHHALLINLHSLPLMEITACTKYIKTKQVDSIYNYTIKSNKLCGTLNVKILILTENIEKFIRHLELDLEQFKKEMAEWVDMLDERRLPIESRTLPNLSPQTAASENSAKENYLLKEDYLKRLVTNRLNRIFPYSQEQN